MTAHTPTPAQPRRGLSSSEAAAYVGVSRTKFLEMTGDGRMPPPVRIDGRTIWDIRALDDAFDALCETQCPVAEVDVGWGTGAA